ncbi:MAG TPA: nicotinate phosphoribosyltransferase [Deltaproteobacteria bacterium]|jgi:nicotinate phosphoribosyltransferase|nr:nicotinate phosphoribosyltransferase [Deltaproteobacteria bacterium]
MTPTSHDAPSALATDLYQLTMLQAYLREGMTAPAVFSLFFRSLPNCRNFALACGLDAVLAYLEGLRFDADALGWLANQRLFHDEFLRWLEGFRFRGDVFAMAEGTPVFPNEPLLEVVASLPEAQLVETLVLNRTHVQTVLASKAVRVVTAACGRQVVDFGMRRMHGTDAALEGARAFFVAGVAGTSNVLAAKLYGIPAVGTMAHSYIQAHDSELAAFQSFTALYPETTLLVDTYDTLTGLDHVIALARDLGSEFRVRGVRLDSGDLGALAKAARARLDGAGLERVEIFASGNLDEDRIAALVEGGAPIDAFGVGTRMGVSEDAPDLDLVYKLVDYAGQGRLKTSPRKELLPGRKQVFRLEKEGVATHDVLARADEKLPGRPLLEIVMANGQRLPAGCRTAAQARTRAAEEIPRLPGRVRGLEPAEPAYRVELSRALRAYAAQVRTRVAG